MRAIRNSSVVRFMQFRPAHRSQIPKEGAADGCLVRPI
jgi:hypothetical protein